MKKSDEKDDAVTAKSQALTNTDGKYWGYTRGIARQSRANRKSPHASSKYALPIQAFPQPATTVQIP